MCGIWLLLAVVVLLQVWERAAGASESLVKSAPDIGHAEQDVTQVTTPATQEDGIDPEPTVRYVPPLVQHSPQTAKPHYDLLVIIPASGGRDRTRIQTVRQTWVREIDKRTNLCNRCKSNRTIRYFFILGDEASAEEKVNRHVHNEGMPEANLMESIQNQTSNQSRNQTMAASDIIALSRCSSAYIRLAEKVRKAIRFVTTHYSFLLLLKTDTDSWIFLDTLLAFAEANDLFNRRSVHAGDVRRGARPVQPKSGGKNPDEVFTRMTGQPTYPTFAAGCGYLLTRNLCNYIALLAAEDSDLPGLAELPQEDVAVGFWLQALEHEIVRAPMSPMADGCLKGSGNRTKLVLDHYVPISEMHRRARNLREHGNPCGKGE